MGTLASCYKVAPMDAGSNPVSARSARHSIRNAGDDHMLAQAGLDTGTNSIAIPELKLDSVTPRSDTLTSTDRTSEVPVIRRRGNAENRRRTGMSKVVKTPKMPEQVQGQGQLNVPLTREYSPSTMSSERPTATLSDHRQDDASGDGQDTASYGRLPAAVTSNLTTSPTQTPAAHKSPTNITTTKTLGGSDANNPNAPQQISGKTAYEVDMDSLFLPFIPPAIDYMAVKDTLEIVVVEARTEIVNNNERVKKKKNDTPERGNKITKKLDDKVEFPEMDKKKKNEPEKDKNKRNKKEKKVNNNTANERILQGAGDRTDGVCNNQRRTRGLSQQVIEADDVCTRQRLSRGVSPQMIEANDVCNRQRLSRGLSPQMIEANDVSNRQRLSRGVSPQLLEAASSSPYLRFPYSNSPSPHPVPVCSPHKENASPHSNTPRSPQRDALSPNVPLHRSPHKSQESSPVINHAYSPIQLTCTRSPLTGVESSFLPELLGSATPDIQAYALTANTLSFSPTAHPQPYTPTAIIDVQPCSPQQVVEASVTPRSLTHTRSPAIPVTPRTHRSDDATLSTVQGSSPTAKSRRTKPSPKANDTVSVKYIDTMTQPSSTLPPRSPKKTLIYTEDLKTEAKAKPCSPAPTPPLGPVTLLTGRGPGSDKGKDRPDELRYSLEDFLQRYMPTDSEVLEVGAVTGTPGTAEHDGPSGKGARTNQQQSSSTSLHLDQSRFSFFTGASACDVIVEARKEFGPWSNSNRDIFTDTLRSLQHGCPSDHTVARAVHTALVKEDTHGDGPRDDNCNNDRNIHQQLQADSASGGPTQGDDNRPQCEREEGDGQPENDRQSYVIQSNLATTGLSQGNDNCNKRLQMEPENATDCRPHGGRNDKRTGVTQASFGSETTDRNAQVAEIHCDNSDPQSKATADLGNRPRGEQGHALLHNQINEGDNHTGGDKNDRDNQSGNDRKDEGESHSPGDHQPWEDSCNSTKPLQPAKKNYNHSTKDRQEFGVFQQNDDRKEGDCHSVGDSKNRNNDGNINGGEQLTLNWCDERKMEAKEIEARAHDNLSLVKKSGENVQDHGDGENKGGMKERNDVDTESGLADRPADRSNLDNNTQADCPTDKCVTDKVLHDRGKSHRPPSNTADGNQQDDCPTGDVADVRERRDCPTGNTDDEISQIKCPE